MADVNTVIIISDKQEFISQISQKLVLLRNLDKVASCTIEEVQSVFDTVNPNVIILHCVNNNVSALNLIKKIKKHENYGNVPILFVNENCSRETVIEAFDNGVSDILFMPVIDYELLIRVIWCLQKNETAMCIESRTNFLTTLGIVQSESGVYSQKYCNEFLKNEITQTKKYSQKACLLLISPDKKYPDCKNPQDFIAVLKKSIRLNDSIVIKDLDKYYVYLQKTKLNGAYSVFERINQNLGIDSGANAGVVEIQEQKFEDIVEALEAALEKASENTNSLIVASDFYSNTTKNSGYIEQSIQNTGDTVSQKSVKNINQTKSIQNTAFDKNSIKLFNQAYNRKLRVVVEPVFRKYESILKIKGEDFAINSYVGNKSLFSVSSGTMSASILLEYDGIEHTTVRLTITENDQKRLFETDVIDFTVLDYRKLSLMLSELIDKFIIILKKRS